ncbi:DHH family phosphoesterase [Streptococcus oricebi]|uniref:Cyclic-di-AMP phosphodiesterase n=1 Tax=Streptococcus oricebi TaxID=1547447 RepID=A0ABS5B6K9_9STRE|nr:DHH family phosphoesterase [Streptococcus oricebi]MBP2624138.1 DHH family phosphoesterase [Streptococcus oricebi]
MVKWRNKRFLMQKFRLAPIHFIMLGVISFGILAILLRLYGKGTIMLLALFVVIALLVYLFIYQQRIYEMDEIEQIHYINHQAENSLTSLLDKMPVGVIKLDEETGDVEWFNPYAELLFTTEEGEFDTDSIQKIIKATLEGSSHYVTVGENKYSIYLDRAANVFYFFDVSTEYEVAAELITTRPVIGIISVDNYDDLEDEVSDSDISHVNSFVANFIAEFAEEYRMFYRRVGTDRFYLFTDYTVLDQLMQNKFQVIDIFRNRAKERELPLTLSMGFSYGDGNHGQIGKVALLNLNLAEVRGGDQAVVKENDEHKNPIYFGGGTASSVKRTRTRTRAMMTAISDKIKTVDQVFIVGHKNMDMDALGAAVGMQVFASNLIDKAYVVYDNHQLSIDIERAIGKLQAEDMTKMVTVAEAITMVTSRSLLIMVDHSKLSLTLSRDFYDQFNQIIVVDHHRRDDDFPDNAVISYIESGASSASELVTELIQFQNSKKNRLCKIQASILMAGMMLDTKNFTARVTSRTFDVASYLRTRGSDSVAIQDISATDFDEYRSVNELILRGRKLLPNVIVASGPEETSYDTVVISKAADTMLAMSGIEATFVVSRNVKGYVSISARSRSKINVQRIMEQMGGGGHFNLAAAQLQDVNVAEATTSLNQYIIDEVIKNEERKL